jgi:hypothetical protein
MDFEKVHFFCPSPATGTTSLKVNKYGTFSSFKPDVMAFA